MPSSWQEVLLGDAAEELTVGFVGTMASEYETDGVPFLRSQNVEPFRLVFDDVKYINPQFHLKLKKSALCPGDVVIVRTGKPGTAAVVPSGLGELNCSDLVIIRPGSRLNSRFLCYHLNGIAQGHISAHLVGAVQQHFNVGSARLLPLRLPPLSEQHAIASILGALDDKIELNRRMNETLEELARTIFKSWFVDFDPVKAKAEGRQPEGMDAETAALFPNRFVESELGMIPEGWEASTLGRVIELQDEKRIPVARLDREKRRGPYPYYGASDVVDYIDDYLFDGTFVLLSEDGENLRSRKTPIAFLARGKFWVNNHAHVLLGRLSLCVEHLVIFLQSCDINPYLTGAVQPKLSQENLRRIPFIEAPDIVHASFANAIRPLYAQDALNDAQTQNLTALRDYLLPKLISGELRVPDAERLAEAVL